MQFKYRFPVIRGVQAYKEYYVAMVPLNMISRLFPEETEYIPPEYRAQRKLNEARVPTISRYILDNRDSYVFSALAASIDGEYRFIPDKENRDAGILEVSMNAKFLINDGQHRKAAILSALKEDETLGDETISIVFYSDKGLTRSQQIFTDLNKNAVKTSNSISELYDSRDQLAVINRKVITRIEFLNEYTDKEKDILGKYSSNLFTLNTFYSANRIIISGRQIDKDTERFIENYWSAVTSNMLQWQELVHKQITKVELRENYIATQGIVIQALGRIGYYFNNHDGIPMDKSLSVLGDINWKRSNKQWYMRVINSKGRIITNKNAAILITNVIKNKMGIELSKEELIAEKKLQIVLKG